MIKFSIQSLIETKNKHPTSNDAHYSSSVDSSLLNSDRFSKKHNLNVSNNNRKKQPHQQQQLLPSTFNINNSLPSSSSSSSSTSSIYSASSSPPQSILNHPMLPNNFDPLNNFNNNTNYPSFHPQNAFSLLNQVQKLQLFHQYQASLLLSKQQFQHHHPSQNFTNEAMLQNMFNQHHQLNINDTNSKLFEWILTNSYLNNNPFSQTTTTTTTLPIPNKESNNCMNKKVKSVAVTQSAEPNNKLKRKTSPNILDNKQNVNNKLFKNLNSELTNKVNNKNSSNKNESILVTNQNKKGDEGEKTTNNELIINNENRGDENASKKSQTDNADSLNTSVSSSSNNNKSGKVFPCTECGKVSRFFVKFF